MCHFPPSAALTLRRQSELSKAAPAALSASSSTFPALCSSSGRLVPTRLQNRVSSRWVIALKGNKHHGISSSRDGPGVFGDRPADSQRLDAVCSQLCVLCCAAWPVRAARVCGMASHHRRGEVSVCLECSTAASSSSIAAWLCPILSLKYRPRVNTHYFSRAHAGRWWCVQLCAECKHAAAAR